MAVVADTHTLIWYLRGSSRLSETAIATLDQTVQAGSTIYLASISLIEITYLVERNRIPESAFEQLIQALTDSNTSFAIVALDLAIAQIIPQIDRATVPEMPDRIIAATALHLNLPLITRDHRIQALQNVQTIW
ncbi:type II toxin-antitoxin system VapC family toxin [Leptolyngbya sp. AN02str]|uniref:type II toxin-antitoxin system VapC family toxin n=1 Tax=Leptolyngbya sp. AN02str TaxID=3423363 RepID=UPI003D3119E1